jgi:hypothetical protein
MSNIPALIITVIVAVLAIVALIFAITVLNTDGSSNDNLAVTDANGSGTEASDINEELFSTARQLVQNNYEVFRLFNLIEFDKDAHFEQFYNNPPEAVNGFYILKTDVLEYDSVDEILNLVNDTFAGETAGKIIETAVYEDRNGRIGVNASYTPKDYDIDWSGTLPIELIEPESEEASNYEYTIIITFIEPTLNEEGEPNNDGLTKQGTMLKDEDGNWRLKDLIY